MAIPRTPPSFLDNPVMVVNVNNSDASGGVLPEARSCAASHKNWNLHHPNTPGRTHWCAHLDLGPSQTEIPSNIASDRRLVGCLRNLDCATTPDRPSRSPMDQTRNTLLPPPQRPCCLLGIPGPLWLISFTEERYRITSEPCGNQGGSQ